MRLGTAHVREVLQDSATNITDKQIQDSLWHYYYDVDKTVDYLIRTYVEEKKSKKAGKKVPGGFLSFPGIMNELEDHGWLARGGLHSCLLDSVAPERTLCFWCLFGPITERCMG